MAKGKIRIPMPDHLTAFGDPVWGGGGAQDNPRQAGACTSFLFFSV
ncbi:MAG: hypothetical protein R3279_13830 [Putridiphycobacter sp.]|nr:hypothetical protein [Putridiphycobacter sp.]